jgi:MscS family membrane protein
VPKGVGVQVPSLAFLFLLMPEIFSKIYYGNTLLDWAVTILFCIFSYTIAKIVYWLMDTVLAKWAAKTETPRDDLLLASLKGPTSLAVGLIGLRFSLNYPVLSTNFDLWVDRIYHILFVVNGAWIISRLVDAFFAEILIPLAQKTNSRLDDMIIPFVRKVARAIIWSLGLIIGLNNAGYNVGALLTGLGIGGVAVALAARNTISNVFGGLTVFIDQPFRIGEKIRIKSRVRGIEGKVLDVGLRQTRIQTNDGTMMHIPNSMFANDPVENLSMEESKKVTNFFKIHKKTQSSKVEESLNLLRKIAQEDPDVLEPVILSFVAIEDSYLGILYIYFIDKEKDDNQVQTRINLTILEKFAQHDIHWAENLMPVNVGKGEEN